MPGEINGVAGDLIAIERAARDILQFLGGGGPPCAGALLRADGVTRNVDDLVVGEAIAREGERVDLDLGFLTPNRDLL
jgi:hypothetical protein